MRNKRLSELATILVERKYPLTVVNTGIKKAIEIPRSELLQLRERNEESITQFISTHNPKNVGLFGIIKQNLEMFKNDETMVDVIKNTKVIKCNRQLPNLKRMLIKSEFRDINIIPKVSKCKDARCGLCDYLIEGSSFCFDGNKTFHVKENMDCTVRNVLYALVCNGCKEIYIGQTGDKLRNRRTVHDQQIRDPSTRQIPLSSHLDTCCRTEPKFSIFPFYKFHSNDVSARLSKERYFINVFSPKLNRN